jgi:hypothetical protein
MPLLFLPINPRFDYRECMKNVTKP